MPIRADAPLRKVTMNFYAEDIEWLQREYGDGWTERIRQHIHNEVQKRRRPVSEGDLHEASNNKTVRRTLGDLLSEL